MLIVKLYWHLFYPSMLFANPFKLCHYTVYEIFSMPSIVKLLNLIVNYFLTFTFIDKTYLQVLIQYIDIEVQISFYIQIVSERRRPLSAPKIALQWSNCRLKISKEYIHRQTAWIIINRPR